MSILNKKPKAKTCPVCKERFVRTRAIQPVCLKFECQIEYGSKIAQKRKEAKVKEDKKLDQGKREKLKTKGDWVKEAQVAFNAFIRERDKNQPCICCGLPLFFQSIGGFYDCGHYRSIGSAPNLRFDERNAHAQRKQCNRWGSGRAVDYRLGLIKRIGLSEVEKLESENTASHWTIDDLKNIKAKYKTKLKELKVKNGH